MVQRIKSLSAKLGAQMFGKGEILHQRKVKIRLSERTELRRQTGNVAELERLRKAKGRCVEIACAAREPAQAVFDLAGRERFPSGSGKAGPRAGEARRPAVAELQRESALERQDSVDLPAARERVPKAI